MMVTLAIYIDDGDWSSYSRQRDAIQSVLKTYGTSNIAGITGGSIRNASVNQHSG